MWKQGKSKAFDSCDQPSNLAQIWSKSSIFQPRWPWNFMDDLKNFRAHLLYYIKLSASFQIYRWIQTGVTVRKPSIGVKIANFFVPCDLEIWWITLENNRAPVLYFIKLCASFQSHGWIQTGVTVRKPSIRVKIGNFLSNVTLKFDRLPWKTIGHLFYVASSFLHHFIVISEFKLELQSGNAHIWVKIYVFFVLCDLEIWKMTLKNNRAPRLCASFGSNWWIQTGVTVWKRPIWVKIDAFFSCVTFKFDRWPWKTIGHLS